MQLPKRMGAFFVAVLLIFVTYGCETMVVESDYKPDTKDVNAPMRLIRFDQDFFELDTTQLSLGLQNLQERYPVFTQGYLHTFLQASPKHPMGLARIKGFISHPDTRYTYDTIQQVFGDLSEVYTQLKELATHYTYYFPEQPPLNRAFTYVSDYHGDRLAILSEGLIGLPLDMALGEGYPPYTFLKMPAYDQRTCNRSHLVPKAADAVAQNYLAAITKPGGGHLIDLMLFQGKLFYLTDLLLPSATDSLKFGFSRQQMDYLQRGELALYEHLSNEELMYERASKKINKYVTKGPFKPHLDLPGNSGSWLGYRIVRCYAQHLRESYAKNQPQLDARSRDQQVLQDLLKEQDPQVFLQYYKPPKR